MQLLLISEEVMKDQSMSCLILVCADFVQKHMIEQHIDR